MVVAQTLSFVNFENLLFIFNQDETYFYKQKMKKTKIKNQFKKMEDKPIKIIKLYIN